LIRNPQVVFLLMLDVFQPASSDLFTRKDTCLMLQQELLVDILNVGIVISAPTAVRFDKNKINSR